MFYYLFTTLIPNYHETPLRLLDYVTFRAGAALVYLLVPKQHSKHIYAYRPHQRARTAPGLLKNCRPPAPQPPGL